MLHGLRRGRTNPALCADICCGHVHVHFWYGTGSVVAAWRYDPLGATFLVSNLSWKRHKRNRVTLSWSSLIVSATYGRRQCLPGAPQRTPSIRHCVAQRIQRWSLRQCGAVRLPGTRTYQSRGIDVHRMSYERSKSSAVYGARRWDISSQCVMRVV